MTDTTATASLHAEEEQAILAEARRKVDQLQAEAQAQIERLRRSAANKQSAYEADMELVRRVGQRLSEQMNDMIQVALEEMSAVIMDRHYPDRQQAPSGVLSADSPKPESEAVSQDILDDINSANL